MFPLFLLVFGIGEVAKIAVAAFSAWLVIVFNVAYGVMNARPTRILAARSWARLAAHISRRDFFESFPQTFVGFRLGVSFALVVIIVAEMFIGATNGMGRRIIDAQIRYSLSEMYASILVAGAWDTASNFFSLSRTHVPSLVGKISPPFLQSSLWDTCDVETGSTRRRLAPLCPPVGPPLCSLRQDGQGKGGLAADHADHGYYVAIQEKLFEKACIEIDCDKMESRTRSSMR